MIKDPLTFVRQHTRLAYPPLVPEVELFLSQDVTALWQAVEEYTGKTNLPPPYWGFAWPGGQAIARLLMEHPERVAGRRVLDFAAGGGLIGIVAARLGASVTAVEIDPLAIAATRLNAEHNGVAIQTICADIVGTRIDDMDVIVAGDVCYERPMTERMLNWLRPMAEQGLEILLGDPGRAYLPKTGLENLATYRVPTPLDLEDRSERVTSVWRVMTA